MPVEIGWIRHPRSALQGSRLVESGLRHFGASLSSVLGTGNLRNRGKTQNPPTSPARQEEGKVPGVGAQMKSPHSISCESRICREPNDMLLAGVPCALSSGTCEHALRKCFFTVSRAPASVGTGPGTCTSSASQRTHPAGCSRWRVRKRPNSTNQWIQTVPASLSCCFLDSGQWACCSATIPASQQA